MPGLFSSARPRRVGVWDVILSEAFQSFVELVMNSEGGYEEAGAPRDEPVVISIPTVRILESLKQQPVLWEMTRRNDVDLVIFDCL